MNDISEMNKDNEEAPEALKRIEKALKEVKLMQKGDLPKKTVRELLTELREE